MKYLLIAFMLFTACETEIIRTNVINPPETLEINSGMYCVDGKYSFLVTFWEDQYTVRNNNNVVPACGLLKNPFPEWGAELNYNRDNGMILFPNSIIQMQVIDSRTIKIMNNGTYNGTAKKVD